MKKTVIFLIAAFLMIPVSSGSAQTVDWQEIRDAILDNAVTSEMDVNDDGKVDVADVVASLEPIPPDPPPSLVGEHIGILFRDNANMIQGQSGVVGQMPFALKITSEDPLQGEIDNQFGELGHYSLYFPKGIFPVTFSNVTEMEMDFQVRFTTSSSNLSPDTDLTRKMTFDGEFSDQSKRVLIGTYSETISGFKDNQGDDIPLTLTGKFILIFE